MCLTRMADEEKQKWAVKHDMNEWMDTQGK